MELTVGAILEGKVKSITNFGAFIALPENKTGMVHISEVANTYVSDIRQHLTEGQEVKVVVIGLETRPSSGWSLAPPGTALPVSPETVPRRLRARTVLSAARRCPLPRPRRPTSCLRKS